jgi:hypothetical protein
MRGVVKMRNNQSFYQVIKIGGDFLWVPIPSKRHFENPMMIKGKGQRLKDKGKKRVDPQYFTSIESSVDS